MVMVSVESEGVGVFKDNDVIIPYKVMVPKEGNKASRGILFSSFLKCAAGFSDNNRESTA